MIFTTWSALAVALHTANSDVVAFYVTYRYPDIARLMNVATVNVLDPSQATIKGMWQALTSYDSSLAQRASRDEQDTRS